MFHSIAVKFTEGGPFMWVILIVFGVACAVMIERLIYYFIFCRGNGVKLVADIAKSINNDTINEAKDMVCCRKTPLYILLRIAVERFDAGMTADDIQEGVEEAAINEMPKLSQRLNYLSLFANIATLLGLLGTIAGLQVSFGSLAAVEASQKATMLARGISQAMNTTAFGLIVAVPCMVMYTILSNKKQQCVKEVDESVVRLMNYLRKKRS